MALHYGGSFAPPLDASKLASYRTLAGTATRPVADGMMSLISMMEAFHKQPASTNKGKPRASGRGEIVQLEKPVVDALDPHVPWDHEIKALSELFDTIPNDTQKPLRDAAFHLLWFATELAKDREPITKDKL